MTTKSIHNAKVAKLIKQFKATEQSKEKIATDKKTTNLFRERKQTNTKRLGMRDLNDVISIDSRAKIAVVEGMCTYEQLVEETLKHNLMPAVVPQLKTITLGGAVTGIGIESSSYKYGFPHETVVEMEILTGDGKVTTARPTGPHKDLFFGFPNSYGSLGYALSLTIKLIPAKPFVRTRYIKFSRANEYFSAMKKACLESSWEETKVDFIDGVIFGPREMYLVLGTMVADAPYTHDYTYKHIFYKSIQTRHEDYLTIKDYIWRWDTDWFWCSRVLGAQNPILRRLYGRNRLRSEFYMKLFSLEAKYHPAATTGKLLKRPKRESIIQDVELPIQSAETFLKFFNQNIGIKPVWNCPVRQLNPKYDWTLFKMKPGQLYVNFGFWDSAPAKPNWPTGHLNRKIELMVEKLKGKKSLYSDSFYTKEEFNKLYNGKEYAILKSKYDPKKKFKDLYDKTVNKG